MSRIMTPKTGTYALSPKKFFFFFNLKRELDFMYKQVNVRRWKYKVNPLVLLSRFVKFRLFLKFYLQLNAPF